VKGVFGEGGLQQFIEFTKARAVQCKIDPGFMGVPVQQKGIDKIFCSRFLGINHIQTHQFPVQAFQLAVRRHYPEIPSSLDLHGDPRNKIDHEFLGPSHHAQIKSD